MAVTLNYELLYYLATCTVVHEKINFFTGLEIYSHFSNEDQVQILTFYPSHENLKCSLTCT